MRKRQKRQFRRSGVSTMIGGIIVLTLFLTALTAMVLISQQYDSYQTTLDAMSQQDIERISENIGFPYPGLSNLTSVAGCGGSCNQYNLTISNLAGVGTQVARVYVNQPNSIQYPLIILNPSSTPASFSFQSQTSFIDPGEASHQVVLWFPSSVTLPANYPEANTISVVTTRGRVFSFQWPFPAAGPVVPTGSTVDMGPFRISYDWNVLTYTTNSRTAPGASGCADTDPSPTPCVPGGWYSPIPASSGIVFYVKLYNLGGSSIILLDKSALIAHQYPNGPSTINPDVPFYIVQPMSSNCYNTYFQASYFDGSWSSITGNCPVPSGSSAIGGYNATYPTPTCSVGNPCYNIPAGSGLGQPGEEEYVLFAANQVRGTIANSLTAGNMYEMTLALYYRYNGYEYSMILPLMNIST